MPGQYPIGPPVMKTHSEGGNALVEAHCIADGVVLVDWSPSLDAEINAMQLWMGPVLVNVSSLARGNSW